MIRKKLLKYSGIRIVFTKATECKLLFQYFQEGIRGLFLSLWSRTVECKKDNADIAYYCLLLTNDHEEGQLNVKEYDNTTQERDFCLHYIMTDHNN